MAAVGGGDPRIANANPGPDGLTGTEDDVLGSPGVVHRDIAGIAVDDPVFGFLPQVTPRNSPSIFISMFSSELFMDGRAGKSFVDPADGITVLMPAGAALESQAVEPILSSVEMAKDGRTWSDVTDKLAAVTPLALTSQLPPDLATVLDSSPDYPQLFAGAFGDPAITPARIAMTIATYERTLIADQTPWDLYMAGDEAAMNATQIRGWELLRDETTASASAVVVTFDERDPVFPAATVDSQGFRFSSRGVGMDAPKTVSLKSVITSRLQTSGLNKVGYADQTWRYI